MMLRLLFLLILPLSTAPLPGQAQDILSDRMTMPLADLERAVKNDHPYGYIILAVRKFQAGDKEEAVRWFYVGQLRWRFHIAANPDLPPDGDPALLASMLDGFGRPINEWVGGDVDGWIAFMQAALDWDEANHNGFTAKEDHPTEYRRVRNGLVELITSIRERREEIPGERERNGLENRVPTGSSR
ncbi:hypothetical protein [Aurantimonas endophytica]|uniref:Uncharacterized protein n=1 Tax=Aurantimonas endophytica TaxID=1522175 RepID=A0A7W6HDH6_9HYPH|nr:hypothetical protein [Aurantimonas endophytica]MBB4003201.1 hypothetical protein [Aurantimonas endophytica]MCO6404066.1 hypothetical protein [Aurantimonas endophytica]